MRILIRVAILTVVAWLVAQNEGPRTFLSSLWDQVGGPSKLGNITPTELFDNAFTLSCLIIGLYAVGLGLASLGRSLLPHLESADPERIFHRLRLTVPRQWMDVRGRFLSDLPDDVRAKVEPLLNDKAAAARYAQVDEHPWMWMAKVTANALGGRAVLIQTDFGRRVVESMVRSQGGYTDSGFSYTLAIWPDPLTRWDRIGFELLVRAIDVAEAHPRDMKTLRKDLKELSRIAALRGFIPPGSTSPADWKAIFHWALAEGIAQAHGDVLADGPKLRKVPA